MALSITDQLSRAAGLPGSIELIIESREGEQLARGELTQPFAMIGSDPDCDITFNDPEVPARLAFLQVVRGKVFIVDLTVSEPLQVHELSLFQPWHHGAFFLRLGKPLQAPAPQAQLIDLQPFRPNATIRQEYPPVVIRFLHQNQVIQEWPVDRHLTIIGQAPVAKIRLDSPDISAFHALLFYASSGLWVVDLLTPRGLSINDSPRRFGKLENDDVLKIGSFVMQVHYPSSITQPSGRSVSLKGLSDTQTTLEPTAVLETQATPIISLQPASTMHAERRLTTEHVTKNSSTTTDYVTLARPPMQHSVNEELVPHLDQMTLLLYQSIQQVQQNMVQFMEHSARAQAAQMQQLNQEFEEIRSMVREMQEQKSLGGQSPMLPEGTTTDQELVENHQARSLGNQEETPFPQEHYRRDSALQREAVTPWHQSGPEYIEAGQTLETDHPLADRSIEAVRRQEIEALLDKS